MASSQWLIAAVVLVLVIGPLACGAHGAMRSRGDAHAAAVRVPGRNRRAMLVSGLLFTLAFNLTFFVQELCLVLPKAFLPGVHVTLYHNNHGWEGNHPMAALFQGTGALATSLLGLACLLTLRTRRVRSTPLRLFLFWMALCGLFMALPQVVIGARLAQADVGMAMDYLGWSATTKTAAALAALALMAIAGLALRRPLLELVDAPARIATPGARSRFVWRLATLPALLSLPAIVLYRVPREWLEVLLLPAIVVVAGLGWLQAAAWRIDDAIARGAARNGAVGWLLAAAVALLLVFQCLLRPGIAFS